MSPHAGTIAATTAPPLLARAAARALTTSMAISLWALAYLALAVLVLTARVLHAPSLAAAYFAAHSASLGALAVYHLSALTLRCLRCSTPGAVTSNTGPKELNEAACLGDASVDLADARSV